MLGSLVFAETCVRARAEMCACARACVCLRVRVRAFCVCVLGSIRHVPDTVRHSITVCVGQYPANRTRLGDATECFFAHCHKCKDKKYCL